ncbi:MAG TPA: PAS domain S-box protein [Dongiaceae bacterium]|nr:PAS domain S-box protein [Dongiaceae bacterium]
MIQEQPHYLAESLTALQSAVIDQVAIVAVTDAEGTILSVNDRFLEVSGYSRSELIGNNHRVVNSGLHPREFWSNMYRTISAGRIWRGEVRNRAKNGSYYWVDTHIIPSFDADGRIESYTAVRFEVTQRKVAEEAYRRIAALQAAILDHGGFGVISTGLDGTIELFNRAAEQMLGYRAEDVIGKANPSMFHDTGEIAERARRFSAELGIPVKPDFETFIIRSQRGLSNEFEWTYRHKDGRHFPVLLSVTALRDADGMVTGYLGMAADISERRDREQALRIAQVELKQQFEELIMAKDRLEIEAARQVTLLEELALATDRATAATEAKSGFLATMSHEIRTPMNGIIGVLNMLQSTSLSAEQAKLVEIALRSSHDLVQITSDILDYSKLEANKTEIEQADFDLGSLIEDVMTLLMPSAINKGLRLASEINTSLPCYLTGDAFRIRQILLNLLSNAIKFTADGSVLLRIDMADHPDGRVLLSIKVQDTGIGLDEPARERIFARFAQADMSTSRRFGGSGLGLAICKQLTDLMNGRIGVDSAPGQGSTFWVDLPLRAAKAPAPVPGKAARKLPPLKLLVAEDNSTNQLIIRTILESLGHHVTLVDDGRAALKAVQREAFDMVLMDVQMPVMDGPTATGEIRRLTGPAGQVPIIALTANAMSGDRESYVAAGMNDYVSKPIDPKRLLEALARQGENLRRLQQPRDR